jgi:membrane associated rhomboid family serine protease
MVTLWYIGRALENRWGSSGWAYFFIITTLAVALWSFVIGISGWGLMTLSEPWIVLGGAMMLWAWESPELPLLAYGMFPVKAIYFALIFVAFEFFQLISSGFLLALTALIPVGIAWLWLRLAWHRDSRRRVYKKEAKKRSYLKRVK